MNYCLKSFQLLKVFLCLTFEQYPERSLTPLWDLKLIYYYERMYALIYLVLFSFLLIPSYAEVTEDDLILLKEYKQELHPRAIKTQCVKDCFNVSSITVLEDMISQKLGEDIQISMIHIYHELLKTRIKTRYIRDLFLNTTLPAIKEKSKQERIQIFFAGTTSQVLKVATEAPLYVSAPPTEKERYLILQNTRNYHKDIEEKLENLDHEIQSSLRDFSQENFLSLKDLFSNHLENLNKAKEIANQENDFSAVEKLKELIESLQKLKKIKSLTIQSLYQALQEVQIHASKLSSFQSNNEILKAFLDKLKKDQSELIERTRDIEILINKKKEALVGEVTNEMENFSKSLDSFQKAKLSNSKRVYLSSNYPLIPESYREDVSIFRSLKTKNLPALLTYNFVIGSVNKTGELLGVQQKKDHEKIQGLHQAVVIDTIEDSLGRIRFLVIQNSWGKSFGYKGLKFMHISYAHQIKEIEYLNYRDFKVSDSPSCNVEMRENFIGR